MTDPVVPVPVVYTLNLEYRENSVVVDARTQGYRIAITASVKFGYRDANIFRYQQLNAEEALFTGVCSPADLVDYSQNPSPKDGFFRRNLLDLVFASQTLAYEIRDEILEELRILSEEMARLDNTLSDAQTIEVSS
jgi:hypothetical protein